MPDQFDAAQRVAEQQLDEALADHHRRVKDIRASHGRTHCAECGEEIPVRRREIIPECQLCVECQSDLERGGFK